MAISLRKHEPTVPPRSHEAGRALTGLHSLVKIGTALKVPAGVLRDGVVLSRLEKDQGTLSCHHGDPATEVELRFGCSQSAARVGRAAVEAGVSQFNA